MAVSIFLSLSPLNQKAHRQREQGGPHEGISQPLASSLPVSRPPQHWAGGTLEGEACSDQPRSAAASTGPQLPLPTPPPPTFPAGGRDVHLPELGPQKAPRGAPPESLTPHLASALCPLPCPGSSLAEPLQIQANSDPRGLPDKTGSQWRHQVLSRMKNVQAESRAHGETLQSPLRLC